METTQMLSLDEWVNKMWYNAIVFCFEKEENSDTRCNMDEPWKHYADKPVTKG